MTLIASDEGAPQLAASPQPLARVRAAEAAAPLWLSRLAVFCAGVGVMWREWWVLIAHRADRAIYSDMANYCQLALRLADPKYHQGPSDTVQAMGMAFWLGGLHALCGSWTLALWATLALCLATPALIAWMAWRLMGPQVGWITLIIASLYFPLIDFGGYFLAETPFTLLLVLGTCLMLHGIAQRTRLSAAVWCLAAGTCLGLAATLKSHGLLVAMAFAGWLLWRWAHGRRRRLAAPALALALGAILAALPMMLRTTALTGHAGFISTNGPLNVLIGHYDPKVGNFRFVGPLGEVAKWSCPSAMQRGERKTVTCRFPAYDGASCLRMAWGWIRTHPLEALVSSCDHVLELYNLETYPWPTISTSWKRWTLVAEHLALILITIPAAMMAWAILRSGGGRARRALIVLALPVLCLWLTVFLTSSEPRYRVPFDAFAMVLAAMAYASLLPRQGSAAPRRSDASPPALPAPSWSPAPSATPGPVPATTG